MRMLTAPARGAAVLAGLVASLGASLGAGLVAGLVAGPARAGTTCNFDVECYMTEPCAGSGWALTVDIEARVLSTVFGDLEIVHVTDGAARQIMARGDGSVDLLTIGEEISFFTTHIAAEPATITYVGECATE